MEAERSAMGREVKPRTGQPKEDDVTKARRGEFYK